MGHGDGLWGWVGWAEEDKGGKLEQLYWSNNNFKKESRTRVLQVVVATVPV